MARLTITSPGVEIREIDLSQRPAIPAGTNVFFTGFTNQGPTDEILTVTSVSEFEQIFGKPYTAAERYAYHTMKALADSSANVYFSRLPYGDDSGDIFAQEKYSVLAYPVYPDDGSTIEQTVLSAGVDPLSADNFYIGKPYHLEITSTQYEDLVTNNITWESVLGKVSSTFSDIGNAGIVVLNKSQTTINDSFEGYYVGISDNRNTDPASPYLDVTRVNSVNNSISTDSYVDVPSARLDFKLSATNDSEDSLSEVMEGIPSFNIGNSEFQDTISLGVFKLAKNPFTKDAIALSYVLSEGYTGSLYKDREIQSQTGGNNRSFFIEKLDDESPNIEVFVNPYLAKAFSLSLSGVPTKAVRTLDSTSVVSSTTLSGIATDEYVNELFPLGVYKSETDSNKKIGSLPAKLDRVFDLIENPEVFPIDISVEAGLGTVFASTQEISGAAYKTYDETLSWASLSGIEEQAEVLTDGTTVQNYLTIFNRFETYARSRRKDHLFVADPIRHIFIKGKDTKVEKQKDKNFSQHIYWPLRNLYKAANSNYATTYANWVKVYDSSSDQQVWVPYSGFAAGLMAQNDPWDAPAGFTRGVNRNITDIAFGATKQKQRDQLYKINLNPIYFSPVDGYVTFGQKTLQTKPSAFDRINVRRTFLFLERATKDTLKYFVFEPNSLFTRTNVVNVLTPIFELVRNEGGIYDYKIICDERNNTSDVIDQNQLICDIYIQPTRVSEMILANFHATRTGVNFDELIQ